MPFPSGHGAPHLRLGGWLGFHEVETPGLRSGNHCTVRLDLDNELQPDLLLALPLSAGSTLRPTPDGFLEGAPELVIEIAYDSASYDLHDNLRACRRNGGQEYLVHRVEDGEIDWFGLDRGTCAPLPRRVGARGVRAAARGRLSAPMCYRARVPRPILP